MILNAFRPYCTLSALNSKTKHKINNNKINPSIMSPPLLRQTHPTGARDRWTRNLIFKIFAISSLLIISLYVILNRTSNDGDPWKISHEWTVTTKDPSQEEVVDDEHDGLETVSIETPGGRTVKDIPKLDDLGCDQRIWTDYARSRIGVKVYENRHLFKPCTFPENVVPAVFLINGRSGSDATWQAITTLAGAKSPLGEHTGENKVRTMDFLGNWTRDEGSWWMKEHLCEFTRFYCKRPISGIKWKPFPDSWELPAAQGMLDTLATLNEPRIKVLFMTRNRIDVLLSKLKHHSGGKVTAHCAENDTECLENHLKHAQGLHLSTDTLMDELRNWTAWYDMFEDTMKNRGITYYRTTYEKLYNADDAQEWMNIFKFFGVGPTTGLTMDDVHRSFQYTPTTSVGHAEAIANYQEVYDLLAGTEFEQLLN